MPMRVQLTQEAYDQAQELQEPIYSRVMAIVERLENWPAVSGAKPLRRGLVGQYRIRTGDYRVQFRLQGSVIIVEKIGKRDRFYED